MDTRTGEVMPYEEMERRVAENPDDAKYYKGVPYQRSKPKTGRNEPCPCLSGKKFKKCCLREER